MNSSDASDSPPDDLFGAAQLLLAEKRTALSVLRTGGAIFVLPLSILSLLIATAKMYQNENVTHLLVPVLVVCTALIVLSVFLIARSLSHLRRYDRMLHKLKCRHPILGDLID